MCYHQPMMTRMEAPQANSPMRHRKGHFISPKSLLNRNLIADTPAKELHKAIRLTRQLRAERAFKGE